MNPRRLRRVSNVAQQILPGEHADGLAVVETSSASPSTSAATALATGSVAPTIGSEPSIATLTRVGRARPAGEEGAEQAALADRADHLGRHHRRLGPDHRHLATRRTRAGSTIASAMVSLGWVWTSDGSSPGLLPQHVADHPRPPRRGANP